MVVSHNLSAIFTNRQLNLSTDKVSKSSEKLASGYKINRAADDAAGLSISEKMRWQIRGLERASDNIQDGISLIQVADGALNETHALLHRMRELAVQAANDTNTSTDRTAIQSEIDQLTKEVDRIATTTNFNSDIYPLTATTKTTVERSGFTLASVNAREVTFRILNNAQDGLDRTFNGQNWAHGTYVQTTSLLMNEKYGVVNIGDMWYSHSSVIPGANGAMDHSVVYDNSYDLRLSDLKTDDEGYIYYESKQFLCNMYITRDKASQDVSYAYNKNKGDAYEYLMAPSVQESEKQIWIQMGAKQGQGMKLALVDATAAGIGLTNLSVMSHVSAGTAIATIDEAIEKVSEYRSTFGAQQNRLEHAMSIDNITSENTQVAESRLRDTDIAEEMSEYSKYSIMMQAGQAMLTQANQSTQAVLSLLN